MGEGRVREDGAEEGATEWARSAGRRSILHLARCRESALSPIRERGRDVNVTTAAAIAG
jgi:hypothetical protein